MSDSESVSKPSFISRFTREQLLAMVLYLLAWGLCISASVVILFFHDRKVKFPSWVGSDLKATVLQSTQKTFKAKNYIFAKDGFSYAIEKDVDQKANAENAEPNDEDYGDEEASVFSQKKQIDARVIVYTRDYISNAFSRGYVFNVDAGRPIVRSGDVLYHTDETGKRIYTPAFYRLLAYQEYCSSSASKQSGYIRLLCVTILSALVLLFFGITLYFMRGDFYDAAHKQWLVFVLLVIHIGLLLTSNFIYMLFDNWPTSFVMLIFPSTLVPCLISNMLGRRAGICGAMCLSLLTPILLGGPFQFQFFLYSLICSLITITMFQYVHSRMRFLSGGLYLVLSSFVLAILLTWDKSVGWGFIPFSTQFWLIIPALIALNTLVVILGMLLLPPICEILFNVTTVFTLNELNTRDHPLLERLLKRAPGTYEHSQAVATIASDAARAIGANSRLTKTCAYFHDIGKLCDPKMFVENLHGDEENPHNEISAEESADILRRHVSYGIELATKAHLPHEVKEAIAQHHGTSVMAFFAEKAARQAEEAGKPVPDVSVFKYPGPLPHRPEVLLVSIADVCEAAVRASVHKWPKATSALIKEKVTSLVMQKFQTGQFDDAQISISNLHAVIDAMVESLCVIHHARIEYPGSAPTPAEAASQEKQGEQEK